jgi:hypothetical protein
MVSWREGGVPGLSEEARRAKEEVDEHPQLPKSGKLPESRQIKADHMLGNPIFRSRLSQWCREFRSVRKAVSVKDLEALTLLVGCHSSLKTTCVPRPCELR